jgi:uncharacterized membrane protein
MTKYARPLIVALALLALGASIASLYVHYRIIKDPTYTSFCDINETVSCEAVLESAYATVRGVPVAVGGVIWSALVLLIAARGMRRDSSDAYAAAAGYIFVLATIGLSAVLYLGYASFFVIGKVCPLCMTMYVSVIGIFLVSGGISMSLSALPSRLARDLKLVATTPVPAVLALIFLVGSASLVAFFPRAAEQTVTDAGTVFTPPTETIEPDQLTEFNKWIDAQPRVTLPISNNGAQVLIVKFNDYQCPSCRQTYMEYKGILEKYRNDPKVRFVTMDYPLESECNSGVRSGSRGPDGEGEGQGRGDGGVHLRQSAEDDANLGQGRRAAGGADHRLRCAVPEGARAGEGGCRARTTARRAGDADLFHQWHQDQRRVPPGVLRGGDRTRAQKGEPYIVNGRNSD